MASETGSTPFPLSGAGTRSAGAAVIARQDRIPIWSLSYLFIGIIGIGFLFTFFDIFVINVSFIQTCTQIVAHCNPENSANYFGLPVELNLAGYVVGALILSPLADRFGRRDMLLFTLILTGIGSLYTVFVSDYTNFVIARTITGLGIGADLAIVNTYINEVAPSASRARYTSLIFIMSALGAFFGIWLGLWLTTPAANFPSGLPFALATVNITPSGPQFLGNGWRIMYGLGALLALVGILMRFQLPESPRTRTADSPAISTLRERIAQQYAAPFDAIFDSPEAAELGEIDRTRAIALLIGPAVLGRLSTLPDFDYRDCAEAAVDGFLHVQRAQNKALKKARSESAGA